MTQLRPAKSRVFFAPVESRGKRGMLCVSTCRTHRGIDYQDCVALKPLEERRPAWPPLVSAFWAAIGHWLGAHDTRWLAMKRLYVGKTLDLDDAEITAMQLQRVDADPRLARSRLRVHAKLLRSRAADVDTSEQLAARHPLYRKRLELGANYRADVWYALERDPQATPAQIARKVGCSYEPARSVAEDFRMLQRSREGTPARRPSSSNKGNKLHRLTPGRQALSARRTRYISR